MAEGRSTASPAVTSSSTGRTRRRRQVARRQHVVHARRVRNRDKAYGYPTALRLRGSVLPRVIIPVILMSLWGTLWAVLYIIVKVEGIAVPATSFIPILSIVVGLVLVFRTNTAYERYRDGRVFFGAIMTAVRNLTRLIWVGIEEKSPEDRAEKVISAKLLVAFVVAVKHRLRDEVGADFDDFEDWLPESSQLQHEDLRRGFTCHLNRADTEQTIDAPDVATNLPITLTHNITAYIVRMKRKETLDVAQFGEILDLLNNMVASFSSLERIRNTPIPLAYDIHLKQAVTLYLLTLPFQLVRDMGWSMIVLMAIAAFTLYGVESIGAEIENPFGYDYNDLPLDVYCDNIKRETGELLSKTPAILATWKLQENRNLVSGSRFMWEQLYKPEDLPQPPEYRTREDVRIDMDEQK